MGGLAGGQQLPVLLSQVLDGLKQGLLPACHFAYVLDQYLLVLVKLLLVYPQRLFQLIDQGVSNRDGVQMVDDLLSLRSYLHNVFTDLGDQTTMLTKGGLSQGLVSVLQLFYLVADILQVVEVQSLTQCSQSLFLVPTLRAADRFRKSGSQVVQLSPKGGFISFLIA